MKHAKKILSFLVAAAVLVSTLFVMSAVSAGAADDKIINAYSFKQADRQAYGYGPSDLIYNKDGSVTMMSDFFASQHQALYKISDSQPMADAIELANGPDGDGTLCMAVTIIKCAQKYKGEIQNDKGAEVKARLILSASGREAGKQELSFQNWMSVGQTKVYRFDCSEYEASDFSQVYITAMNYSVDGGAGNFEIMYSPVYATTGEAFSMPNITIPTVDPNIKTSPFLTLSDLYREKDYGNPPDKVKYDKDGGVTISSINTKVQHQVDFYFREKELTNTALGIANREGGTNTVECTVTVLSAVDDYGKTGQVEIQLTLFSNTDVNEYKPDPVIVSAWQAVGTTKTYYMDVSQYKSFSNCNNFKLCAQNYWYYDEAGNLVEHPDWKDGKKYVSAAIAPEVHFSAITVSEKRWDEVKEDDPVYGDANEDGNVDIKDMLAIKKYMVKILKTINLKNADVNFDSALDVKDILLIKKHSVGIKVAPWA